MDFDARLKQANTRLATAKIGVKIERKYTRLSLRATLPPKPGSRRTEPCQQRVYIGVYANPAGLRQAEQEAKRLGLLLAEGDFDWNLYAEPGGSQDVAYWITAFERDYFTRRQRTAKSETTWKDDYLKAFNRLPQDEPLTAELLRGFIEQSPPDTRTRKRLVDCYSRLAKFAGLEVDFSPLRGSYSSASEVREVPPDSLIAEWWGKIPNPRWQLAYGLMAAYGLRNHELFHLDFSKMPVLLVLDGTKTDFHRVWPLYPEWVDLWGLGSGGELPECSGPNNSALGHRVTLAFRRYGVPFKPYDLRHAWAVRSLEFGLPVELASQQMGHSVDVHCRTYHRWISEEVHQRAYQMMMARADRPRPPV